MSTPGSQEWAIATYGLPCKVELVDINFCGKRNVRINKKCARHFKRLGDIFMEKAPAYAKQIDDFLDDWTYSCRKIAGTDVWSNHSWAIAIDVDATKNPRGGTIRLGKVWDEARRAVWQAEQEGFRWGGRYSSPDPMHFETLLTPKQIRARYNRNGKPRRWYKRRLK